MPATKFIDHLLTGDHASRPAFDAVPEGTLYACSDHDLIYQSDGVSAWSTWADVGSGGGITALTGDVTATGPGSVAATIANDAVTNAKSANMAESTIKGRAAGAGTGDPTDLTATQATAILNDLVGDSGAGGTKGLAPAPGAGDAAAGKFLKADATWAVPPGGGAGSDTTAIHDDTSGEIAAITEKVAPVSADLLLIEDSEATNAKKKVQIGNLPTGADADAIHDNVSGEIAAITEKATLVAADLVVIEDSEATNAKKKVQVSNLLLTSQRVRLASITVESPTSSEDIPFFYTFEAITIIEMQAFVTGSTPSVTINPVFDASIAAAGTAILASATAITNTTTGQNLTSFNDATIPADNLVRLKTTAASGTITLLSLTIKYYLD